MQTASRAVQYAKIKSNMVHYLGWSPLLLLLLITTELYSAVFDLQTLSVHLFNCFLVPLAQLLK